MGLSEKIHLFCFDTEKVNYTLQALAFSNSFSPCPYLSCGSTSCMTNPQRKLWSGSSEDLSQDRLSPQDCKGEVGAKMFAHWVRISSNVQSWNDRGEKSHFNLLFYFQCLEMFWMTLRKDVCAWKKGCQQNQCKRAPAAGPYWLCADTRQAAIQD